MQTEFGLKFHKNVKIHFKEVSEEGEEEDDDDDDAEDLEDKEINLKADFSDDESGTREERKTEPWEVAINSKKPANFFVFLGKMRLKEHGKVEFTALGNSMAVACQVTEILERNKYAKLVKMHTDTVSIPGHRTEVKRAKLIIEMTKGEDFDKAMEEFEKIGEERKAETKK